MILIGSMLALSVPLRWSLRSRGFRLDDRRLTAAAFAWGVLVGGTTGAGVILLSMLMAAGPGGAAGATPRAEIVGGRRLSADTVLRVRGRVDRAGHGGRPVSV